MTGLKSALAITSLLLAPAFAQVTVTYTYDGLPIPIFQSNTNIISIANVVVPMAIKTTHVTAQVQIKYPNAGDLQVFLFSAANTRTILTQNNCGGVANIDTTFDDNASARWSSFCPTEPGRGPFQANQPLSNFNNDDSSFGTWQLLVQNTRSNNTTGYITQFSLTITGTDQTTPIIRPNSTFNNASFGNAGVIAPGEFVSLAGLALGPTPDVTAPSGNLPTTLGGTTVLVNGVAAPISLVGLYRINFQVPFGLSPGTAASIQVQATSGVSGTETVNVVNSSPGVYTNGFGGTGSVAANNQDGTANAANNPATRGTVISVFASGLGAVSPAIPEGTVAPTTPLSNTTAQVSAFIGGTLSNVLFAGLAPGQIGIYQVNIQVPTTILAGASQLILFTNGQSSQNGVIVFVQ